MEKIPTILEIAAQVRAIFERTIDANQDLFGGSVLDLMADNIERVSLADLRTAIVVSGIEASPKANARIRREIAKYR